MKNLVIVESPTKARTLSQFLGKDYEIVASMGHVRDLPRGEFGVDVENNFEPKYVIPKEKIKSVNKLVKDAADAETLWLATDPDREGEAIAWNLLQVIREKSSGPKKNSKLLTLNSIPYHRVVFHEITKGAVLDAFEHARKIDQDLVEAQQARRVLDRLVGYKLSPLLWKKVKSRLSAGRVQSVALRLIVEKEREIEAFKSEEYWDVWVQVTKVSKAPKEEFKAKLVKIGDKKAEVKNKKQADEVIDSLEKANYKIEDLKNRLIKKSPSPPFTTSTLQQSASNNLGFSAKRTMRIAQDLYEQGLITYMRTDSVNLSSVAVAQARKYIEKIFGKDYLPSQANRYKVKSRLAQEAHEAIRPTNVQLTTDKVQPTSNDHKKLYDLIHKRMVACQMAEASVFETQVDIAAFLTPGVGQNNYLLRASGQEIKFDGWFRVYAKLPIKEQILPKLEKGEDLNLEKVNALQKFTEPPSRYTEATLIRDLEKHGIGRPSTYAPIISTLYDRYYIERLENKKIGPTPIGKTTVDFLVKYFKDIVDVSFTAGMEDDLDKIAQGDANMPTLMQKFWKPFETQVEKVQEEAEKVKVEVEETNEKCDVCDRPMVIRYGRYGKFMACSGFPECKNTKPLNEETGLICPQDGGKVVMRRTKKGRAFWGCANWPTCKFASWQKPTLAKATDVKRSEESSQ